MSGSEQEPGRDVAGTVAPLRALLETLPAELPIIGTFDCGRGYAPRSLCGSGLILVGGTGTLSV
jgi:hypothetical protein